MYTTWIIIGVTVGITLMAFNNYDLFLRLKHWPWQERRSNEFHRWVTGGFLHANQMHLIFNMISLYFFGGLVEAWFFSRFGQGGATMYVLFYLAATAAASSATYFKYRNSPSFASVGASGAVAAVIFTSILLQPVGDIYFIFIPIPIKSFIFGALYLWYSAYEAKQSRDNIDHTAHYYGALFGFFFPIVMQPSLLANFIAQVILWFQNF